MTRVSSIYEINPIEDPRWGALSLGHPDASVFHSPQWLNALRDTYGFQPLALSTNAPGRELEDGFVFCRVNSWLTGKRFVSLPFSDHCDVLAGDSATANDLISAAVRRLREGNCRYLEIRPIKAVVSGNSTAGSITSYCLHRLDLRPSLETLFNNFHKDSVQRKIRRAEREQLVYEEGRDARTLNAFYGLTVLTRRRHQLPPQPVEWFRNLIESFGEALKIRVAFRSGMPIASILTLRYRSTLVYKYGCSDPRFHNLGSMHFLFWRAIEDAKGEGLETLDLGRSDMDAPGLIRFKDQWGAERSALVYTRFQSPCANESQPAFSGDDRKQHLLRAIVSRLPDRALRLAGRILYKHMG